MEDVLDIDVPSEDDPNFARIVVAKKDAAGKILDANLKSDENCFRQKQSDALAKLYTLIQLELSVQPAIDVSAQVIHQRGIEHQI